jgi:indolepyruvate ferredoxin oxidoreductase beta subunit
MGVAASRPGREDGRMTDLAATTPSTARSRRDLVRILLGTVGGQGGGLLSTWLAQGLINSGWQAQMVGVLGLAQRAGTVTYYVETCPRDLPAPIFSAYPAPGDVDILVGAELLELARQLQAGYAHPRSVVIADVQRYLATLEKMPAADGVYDAEAIIRGAAQLGGRTYLVDAKKLLARSKLPRLSANAVLLGVIAGSDYLQLPPDGFQEAIAATGNAVPNNQEAFRLGYEIAVVGTVPDDFRPSPPAAPTWEETSQERRSKLNPRRAAVYDSLLEQGRTVLPGPCMPVLAEALYRLIDYQDVAYATEYVDRVRILHEQEHAVTPASAAATVAYARHLATWMTFEDVARVAQLKSRPERLASIRREHQVGDRDHLVLVDYLTPDTSYVSHVLPAPLAGAVHRVLRWMRVGDLPVSVNWRTSSPAGYWTLRALAGLRRIRRHTATFRAETADLRRWESAVLDWLPTDHDLAVIVAEAGDLVKGYAKVRQDALADLWALLDELLPALAGLPGCPPADRHEMARQLLRELRQESGSTEKARALLEDRSRRYTRTDQAEAVGRPPH